MSTDAPAPTNQYPVIETVGEYDPVTKEDRGRSMHDMDGTHKKNFDHKIYMFPESYNSLRRELEMNWPNLWPLVGWRMANSAEEFIEYMNAATSLNLPFDTKKVAWTCEQYLIALRRMRGLQ